MEVCGQIGFELNTFCFIFEEILMLELILDHPMVEISWIILTLCLSENAYSIDGRQMEVYISMISLDEPSTLS